MKTLTRWSPFGSSLADPLRDFANWENRLERFFERPPGGNEGKESMTTAEWAPLVDITEDDKEYLVTAELPDIKKEDVKVCVEKGEIAISGERKQEKEEKGKKFHRIERSYGSFLRRFTLPEGVSGEKVAADFKDGVLKVHLPKDQTAKPKAIEVKVQ